MTDLIGKTYHNPLFGDSATFIHTSKETNGQKSVLEIVMHPNGEGPPAHYHKCYSEKFECLEGEIMLQVGKSRHKLLPGDSMTAEIMDLHKFYAANDRPAKFRITVEPAHEGFEQFIPILYGLCSDGLTKKDGEPKKLSDAVLILELSESKVPGILGVIIGITKRFFSKSKQAKRKEELIQKYCV